MENCSNQLKPELNAETYSRGVWRARGREGRRLPIFIQMLIIVQVCPITLGVLERHRHVLKSP